MKRILSISALCAAMFCLVLTGCQNKKFTVTFDSQGGSAVAALTKVADGSMITQPTNPTKDGFDFGGWYKEQACQNVWNFATDVVTGNITLYAKWADAIRLYYVDDYGDWAGTGAYDSEIGFVSSKYVYILDLYSPTATLAAGTYNYDASGACTSLTINGDYSGVIYRTTGETVYFTTGSVTVTKNGSIYKFEANMKDENGITHVFVCESTLNPTPDPEAIYYSEPTTPANVTVNATVLEGAESYGDYYGSGDNLYFVVADADEVNGAFVDFIASGSTHTTLPAGTYTIDGSFGLNTVVAYVADAVDMGGGSYVIYNGSEYFLISGSVNVTAGGFTLTGHSYYGSTITLNYTGSLAIDTGSFAPAKSPKHFLAKPFTAKKVKKFSSK